MMFWVRVPVLSEQMQDVLPSVSTPARVDTVAKLSPCTRATRRLSDGRIDGATAVRHRSDAIAATALILSPTMAHRRGPNGLKIRKRNHPRPRLMATSPREGTSTLQNAESAPLLRHGLGYALAVSPFELSG